VRQFADAGLAVSAIDSSTRLSDSDPAQRQHNLDLGRASIDLAQDLGARYVRVFGGNIPAGEERDATIARVAENLHTLGAYAAAHGDVTVVLETHDDFSLGAQVAEVLERIPHPRVAALWDLHHPFRQGEEPEETLALLGGHIRFTHVKDSRPGDTYCLLGEGDVPIRRMLALLTAAGYDGWISLEWEKRWIPRLEAPEIAFPQYARTLKQWLAEDAEIETTEAE
jgi:sugar phosphate isomerase/epimerase